MFDIQFTASQIAASWPSAVGRLPKALAEAIDAFEATQVVVTPPLELDANAVTAENAEQQVHDLTEALIRDAHFDDARVRLLRALALRVLREAGASVPEVIETLRPQFLATTAEFTEAVQALPEDLSSDALVAAGPATLSQFHRALAAQQFLTKIDIWIDSLNDVPAQAGHKRDPLLRLLRPTSRAHLNILESAVTSGAAGGFNPIFLTAVREEIAWSLNTPIDSAAIRREIEEQPFEYNPVELLRIGS
jgi:hypothetical protein